MSAIVRGVRWPDDEDALGALDRSFETDRAWRVTYDGDAFVLDEVDASPPYQRNEPPLDLDELRRSDAVFVAEHAGDVEGYGALRCERWNRRGVITALYVDKAHRGTGIGRALVDALDDAARSNGMKRLWAETQDINAPAVRFYLATGFSLCGLDTSLYDPDTPAGAETALYFERPIA